MTALLDTSTPRAANRPAPQDAGDRRRWLVLAIVVVAQVMVVLDATIVNIALPDAQAALDMSDANRQWVLTAYSLTFGGLLLLGGRIADFFGRRRTFVIGALGFGAASALGGAAATDSMLFLARGLQGVFAALLAPAALSLLTTTFPSGPERARAFAVYGAVSAGGAAIGLLLGGVLTELLDWRWTLLVNIPIAIGAAVAAVRWVPESRAAGTTRYDVPGALTGTAGLVALVYGFTEAEGGWGQASTLAFLAAGVALLVGFVAIELRSSHPLLPMRIPLDRNRGGAYLVSMAAGGAIGGSFLFLVYFFQQILGYNAIESGLAAIPTTLGIVAAAALAARVVARFGARLVMGAGALIGAAGMAWLSRLGVDSTYVADVLPGMIAFGFGLGLVFVPMTDIATLGVASDDAGAASALTNASQQVGMSLGVALLNTIYAAGFSDHLAENGRGAGEQALVAGSSDAFVWAAVILVAAAGLALTLIRGRDGGDRGVRVAEPLPVH